MDDIFVIGDVHGHLDRLEALLKQEGFLDRCETCDGSGQEAPEAEAMGAASTPWYRDCSKCDGLGWSRLRSEVTVIQLGDLGHFGKNGSPTADTLCYKYVTVNRWADIVLWGNHDRALVDSSHAFSGYLKNHDALHYIARLRDEDRMKMAYSAHGFLITHAGLALAFKYQKVDDVLKTDPVALAEWLNDRDTAYLDFGPKDLDINALAIINAVGSMRGGRVNTGGILWRDIEEKLYGDFRQVFGHSADTKEHAVRYCTSQIHTRKPLALGDMIDDSSYCIDIGGKNGHKGADCLAGIYLPSEEIVRIDL